MIDQRNEEFAEPSREEIVAISRAHVAAIESGNDPEAWFGAGMHHVVIRTLGRRTGREHKVCVPYWEDPTGLRIVVASFSGAPHHPAWYLNLADRTANLEILVRFQEGLFWAEPRILDGDEYKRIWAAITKDRPFYNDYQSRTTRRIPLVALVILRPD